MNDTRTLTFRACNRSRPCPICGHTSWCAVSVEGPVRCMRGSTLGAPNGWSKSDKASPSKKGGGGDGWMFYPGDWDPKNAPKLSAAQVAEVKAKEEQKRRRRQKNALKFWADAGKYGVDGGVDHHVMRGYFEARGIDVDRLPGGRLPDCLRYHPECPDLWNPAKTSWHTFPAVVAKIVNGKGDHIGIHRIFLDIDDRTQKRPVSDQFGEAKKKLGESLGGCVRLCGGTKRGVLFVGEGIETMTAVLEATGLATWAAVDAESLKALDLPPELFAPNRADTISTVVIAGDLDLKDGGQWAASVAANQIKRQFPWVSAFARYPTAKCCPQLVKPGADKTVSADRPIDGKSVDWKEVKVAAGVDAVRAGLLDGIDLEANAARAFHWKDSTRSGSEDPPPPPPPGPPTSDEDDGMPRLIDDSPLLRAQQYLLECESPPPDRRVNSTSYIHRWAGKWWEYDERSWWELDDEALHGRIQQWLDRFYTIKRGKVQRLDPTSKMVEEVIKALRSECLVDAEQMPVMTPATFDQNGSPLFGLASLARRYRHTTRDQLLPDALIPYSNCLLDSKAWTRGQLRVFRHTPRFFCANCLPFPLPAPKLRAALESDGLDTLIKQLCPEWLKFLDKVSKEEPEWIQCLQEWGGYNLIHDVHTVQKVLGLQGPPRSGKSTILTVFRHILGHHNVASSSLKALTERFGLSDLVGKLAVFLPDAHLGKFDDMTAAVENLKSISGADPIRVEEKYAKRAPTVLLTCRVTMAFNKPPSLSDGSGAFAGRLVILPMQESNLGKEDPTLKERLLAEAEGINVWMLQGLMRLMSKPRPALTMAKSSLAAGAEFADDSAPIQMFVEECAELRPGSRETVDEVYVAWKTFCARTGRQAGSRENVGKLLKGYYGEGKIKITNPLEHQGERVRFYEGIRLFDHARPGNTRPLYGEDPLDPPTPKPWQQHLPSVAGMASSVAGDKSIPF